MHLEKLEDWNNVPWASSMRSMYAKLYLSLQWIKGPPNFIKLRFWKATKRNRQYKRNKFWFLIVTKIVQVPKSQNIQMGSFPKLL